jgi:hypothetical protein
MGARQQRQSERRRIEREREEQRKLDKRNKQIRHGIVWNEDKARRIQQEVAR